MFVLRLRFCIFLRICFLCVSECLCRDLPVVVLDSPSCISAGWKFFADAGFISFLFCVSCVILFFCVGVWMAEGVGWSLRLLLFWLCRICSLFSLLWGFFSVFEDIVWVL